LEKLIKMLATGFGSGLSPFAPGTAGTIVAIPLYLALSYLSLPLYSISLLALFFLAVYVSGRAELIFGEKDARKIVIDEIVGFQVTMFMVAPSLLSVLAGFIAFRLFDISKIFPIRLCERKLPGGYGVVGDDVIAGIYGNIAVALFIRFVYPVF
jgi:phosphatidylglycerophosphatase A